MIDFYPRFTHVHHSWFCVCSVVLILCLVIFF